MIDDIERLASILELLGLRGIVARRVRVGSIEVDIIAHTSQPKRLTEPEKDSREAERSLTPDEREKAAKLRELRKRSLDQFGVVKPDAVLLEMDGIL